MRSDSFLETNFKTDFQFMDFPARPHPRVAWSFPEGTIDLESLCPAQCLSGDEEETRAVSLEPRWRELLPRLADLGPVLGSAASGGLSAAQLWPAPDFTWIPGTGTAMDVRHGTEIDPGQLGGVLAVVEQGSGSQEMVNLQFFDRSGAGCLKLILTNLSDLAAFRSLVADFGGGFGVMPSSSAPLAGGGVPCPGTSAVSAEQVRGLWQGLPRTSPDQDFPGIPGCRRERAFALAGADRAWRLPGDGMRQAVCGVMQAGGMLRVTVRNRAVLAHVQFNPTHSQECACGTTFFSPSSQLTLRRQADVMDVWVVRHPEPHGAARLEIECFGFGGFCGAVGIVADPAVPLLEWAALLQAARPR